MRCRHERHSWIIGFHEWCYVCGAFRRLKFLRESSCVPTTKWIKPTGDKDNNPYAKIKEI